MLERLKASIAPFLIGCAVTSAAFLAFPRTKTVEVVREVQVESKVESKIETVENKATESIQDKGKVVTTSKVTTVRPDGSKRVSKKRIVEEPVRTEVKEQVETEIKEEKAGKVDVVHKERTKLKATTDLPRYSFGLNYKVQDIGKGHFKDPEIELGLRLANLPVWGTVSSDVGLNLTVGVRVEL